MTTPSTPEDKFLLDIDHGYGPVRSTDLMPGERELVATVIGTGMAMMDSQGRLRPHVIPPAVALAAIRALRANNRLNAPTADQVAHAEARAPRAATPQQLLWLIWHPAHCAVGRPAAASPAFHEVGTLYADGSFAALQPGQPVKLDDRSFGVGIPTPKHQKVTSIADPAAAQERRSGRGHRLNSQPRLSAPQPAKSPAISTRGHGVTTRLTPR